MSTTVYAGARVVLVDRVIQPGWVGVRDGVIADMGAGTPPRGTVGVVDVGGAYLAPGFVDLHMHGGGGASVLGSREAMAEAVAFHRGHGTAATLVSAVTDEIDAMCAVASWGAELAERDPGVLGTHLEGPFLAHAHRGAQDPARLRTPDLAVLAELLGPGRVRSMTLAPELAGAPEVIGALREAGVIAAVGHTGATYEQARDAFANGASLLTHAYNGMPGIHHRAAGPVLAAADHPTAVAELINDGAHVHAPAARLLFRAMPGRVALITDAIAAAGAPDGEYLLGAQDVLVRDGIATLAGDPNALAGSTLTMDAAVRRAVHVLGLKVEEAIAAATAVPANVLNERRGRVQKGYRADLLLLGDDMNIHARHFTG